MLVVKTSTMGFADSKPTQRSGNVSSTCLLRQKKQGRSFFHERIETMRAQVRLYFHCSTQEPNNGSSAYHELYCSQVNFFTLPQSRSIVAHFNYKDVSLAIHLFTSG